MINNKKIGIGSEIEIIKSGKIIPKIHKVIKAIGSANIPTNCPSCKENLIEVSSSDGALSLVCNNSNCPAQNIKNINHWFKILGVKGIAEKNIEKLLDVGIIQKIGDFYRLTVDELISYGFTERTSVLIVARIWMLNSPEQEKNNDVLQLMLKKIEGKRIKVSIEKFFSAFGIKTAGKEAGRILSQEIGNWEKIKNSSITELEIFDGIGPIMAHEIVSFFKKNKDMVEDVEQYFRFEEKILGGGLEGKSFVLSGALEGGKAYWKSQIESKGGVIKGSVSKKTSYLIASEGSGSKTEKALKLGIPILTTENLKELLSN